MRVEAGERILCLRCLAGREEDVATIAEVFELDEGACDDCGRFGPVARRTLVPVGAEDEQAALPI